MGRALLAAGCGHLRAVGFATAVLWVAYLFAGVLCFEKTMGVERQDSALAGLLNPKGTGPVLDAARTAAHIEQLRRHFVGVLGAIKTVYEDADVEIPVLIPGYDHPVPNGKGVFPRQREWLLCPQCRRSAIFDVKRGTRN